MSLLTGQNIIITGASRGIGKATALLCAQNGANLILTANSHLEDLLSFKKELEESYGIWVKAHKCDVSKEDEIKAIFKEMVAEGIKPDALVNNAGIMKDAVLTMATSALMEEIFRVNVFGSMLMAQQTAKMMLKQRRGSIVNMTSIIGTHGNAGQSIYGSSKSAIISFTKSLSKELAPFNIRVNAIAPGFIETDMTKNMDVKFYEKNLNSIGMKRLGQPLDVARVALFLMSELSTYVTGQVIGVDGSMVI